MGLLLKREKDPSRSIEYLLLRYFRIALGIILFSTIAGIGAYSIKANATDRANRLMFLVNGFYTDLQVEQDKTYRFTTGQSQGASAENELKEGIEALKSELTELHDKPISSSYRRQIDDLTGMMTFYQESVNRLLASSYEGGSPDGSGTRLDIYYNTERIFRSMQDTFHSVYDEVMSECEAFASRADRLALIYVIIDCFAISLLIWYLIHQGSWIEKTVVLPVAYLENELQQMDLNQLERSGELSCPPEACSDIRMLIQVYNTMLATIQSQLREREEYTGTRLALKEQEVLNLQISNELKKAQLANLHAQINPHFLFNTLNMISQSAFMTGDGQTVQLLEMTSDLLRYSLDYSDRAVPLQKEIEILGNYVALQEMRFGSRITFCFDLDESFHDTLIPNLILQPLVENAIVHGVNTMREGARVTIQTQYRADEGMGYIRVIDNGMGMDEARLKEVDEKMRAARTVTGKDGLTNVYLRLYLFFDGRADLTISSPPGEGCCVCIKIPS